jgi:bifunctional DNase/RNase
MDSRVELKVLGITYSQVQKGAYALLLSQVDGPYRIPVVVGVAEAQSIAMKLENIIPPRPMSHDLMVSLFHAFGISLEQVFIYKFHDGTFLSELTLKGKDAEITLDSRTSDAIALAVRTDARASSPRRKSCKRPVSSLTRTMRRTLLPQPCAR